MCFLQYKYENLGVLDRYLIPFMWYIFGRFIFIFNIYYFPGKYIMLKKDVPLTAGML